MFGDFVTADLVAIEFMRIDVKCRKELQAGRIISERDYVTAFGTRIRDRDFPAFECFSQTLRSADEQKNGADGIMVFKYGSQIKIGIFEAKRPQLIHPNYRWDELSSRAVSHFTEQIENQHKWKDIFAVWEMFLNDTPDCTLSPPFEPYGSTCVWHKDAYRFAGANGLYINPWKTSDLKLLVKKAGVSIYSVVYDILCCKKGRPLSVNPSDSSVTVINPGDNGITMEIPLPLEIGSDYDQRIASFMEKNGFELYTYFDLPERKYEDLSEY
ncbi:hypothetical protein [Flavobacterium sp. fv08]|uniref:hypothetical protein n=1 Tax=Flavobacterium sp. fv08 TaxID=1761784 RepID=UPI0008B2FA82|nr:hypothetical protein [Flavobacterium sp. fv08]SEP05629.1 hypothetical protein SAMN04487978_4331 [Flavobacterium sp. fv08]